MSEMSIQLSDGPAKGLVRIHTEHADWDEPDVRYLRRKAYPAVPAPRPSAASDDRVVFLFGTIEVQVRVAEDRVEVVLRHGPLRVARAA